MNKNSINHRESKLKKNIHSTFKFCCSIINWHELILSWQSCNVWGQASECASHYWASWPCLSHRTRSLTWSIYQADDAVKPHRLSHKPQPGCTVEARKTWNTEVSRYIWKICMVQKTTLHPESKKTKRALLVRWSHSEWRPTQELKSEDAERRMKRLLYRESILSAI